MQGGVSVAEPQSSLAPSFTLHLKAPASRDHDAVAPIKRLSHTLRACHHGSSYSVQCLGYFREGPPRSASASRRCKVMSARHSVTHADRDTIGSRKEEPRPREGTCRAIESTCQILDAPRVWCGQALLSGKRQCRLLAAQCRLSCPRREGEDSYDRCW